MIKSNSNIPIFRRLLLTFAIAAAVPAFVIIFLGNFYLTSLATRGQAVQTSFDAQSIASAQETNLQVMNALVKTSLNNMFAGQSATVHDPSLVASGGLIFSDLTAREADFDHTLATYQSNYEVATSSNMSTIRTILLNDNLNRDVIIINDQQQALSESTKQWHLYRQFQDTIINQLAPLENDLLQGKTLSNAQLNLAYERIYPTYNQANIHFTDLRISWLRVVDAASSMGKTVAAVGSSQTLPVYTSIISTCTILLIFAIVWGFTSFRLKRSYSFYDKNSRILNQLSEKEKKASSEQVWIVEASKTGLKSQQYYTEASKRAVRRLNELGGGLLQQRGVDMQTTLVTVKQMVNIGLYFEQAIAYQDEANKKVAVAVNVTDEVSEQLASGAESASEAANELDRIVKQLRQIVGS